MVYYYVTTSLKVSKRLATKARIAKNALFFANSKAECLEYIEFQDVLKGELLMEEIELQESADINDLDYPDMAFASGYGYNLPKMAIKTVRKYTKKVKTPFKHLNDFIMPKGHYRQTNVLDFAIGHNIVKKAITKTNSVIFNDAGYSQFMQWKQDVVESKLNHNIWVV